MGEGVLEKERIEELVSAYRKLPMCSLNVEFESKYDELICRRCYI